MKINAKMSLGWSRPAPGAQVLGIEWAPGHRPTELRAAEMAARERKRAKKQSPSMGAEPTELLPQEMEPSELLPQEMVSYRLLAAAPPAGDRYGWIPMPMLYPNRPIQVSPNRWQPPRGELNHWEPMIGNDRSRFEVYSLGVGESRGALDQFIRIGPNPFDPFPDERPDVVSFVNSFGLLGLEVTGLNVDSPYTEPVWTWDYCARELRTFVKLALFARTRQPKIELTERDGKRCLVADVGKGYLERRWIRGRLGFFQGDYVLPMPDEEPDGWEWNDDPRGALFAALKKPLTDWLDPLVTLRMEYDEWGASDSPRYLQVGLKPKNLLGALWMEAAAMLDARMSERPCPGCDEYFAIDEVSTAGSERASRSDLIYCSDKCAKRVSRKREGPRQVREEIKRLRMKGLSDIEVATTMGLDASDIPALLKVSNPGRRRTTED